MIVCPGCRENNDDQQTKCINCGTDLTPLIRIREQYKLHYNHGLVLAQKGEFQPAVQALLTAATLNPREEQAYVVLGKLYAGRNDFKTAEYYWNQALKINPDNEKALAGLSKVKSLDVVKEPVKKAGSGKWFMIGGMIGAGLVIMMLLVWVIGNNHQLQVKSITRQITQALARNPATAGIRVTIPDKQRLVILSGSVPQKWQRQMVIDIAGSLAPQYRIQAGGLKISQAQSDASGDYLYVIREGDTGAKLAKRFYGDSDSYIKIKQANPKVLANDFCWPVGEVIVIPGPVIIFK